MGLGKGLSHGGDGEVSGSAFCDVSVSSAPTEARGFQGNSHALRVDLSSSDGRRVLIEGAANLAAIFALVEGLSD